MAPCRWSENIKTSLHLSVFQLGKSYKHPMVVYLVGFLFILLALVLYKSTKEKSSIPQGLKELPSVNGLPVLGIFHEIKKPFCVHFSDLVKTHGPLFKIRLGMRDVVILNSYDIIKKAFKDQGDNFAGRFRTSQYKAGTHNSGIIFHEGEMWIRQRSFLLNVFRDFGIYSSKCLLLTELDKRLGMETDFTKFSTIFLANIISKFIINKRLDLDGEAMQNFDRFLFGIARSKDYFQLVSLMYPFLDKSPLFFKFITVFSFQWRVNEKMHKYYQKVVDEHLEKLDFDSEGEDLIDRFFIKQREMETKTGSVDSFTNWQIIRIIIELFLAGFETLSTTLGWSLFFMSRYPDVQEKVYLEIVDKIGDKQPSLSDKVHLSFSQAVMDEIYRMSSPAPMALVHQNFEDCSLNGFFIPKKSIVFSNLYACHHDPNIWEKPMEFNPARFLSEDSNGEFKYTPREKLITFGVGKRQCLGESLARMEYFIFFTRILQRFQVSFCEEINEKRYNEILVGSEGIIRHCLIKNFTFTNRN